jgi:hypothetical protein
MATPKDLCDGDGPLELIDGDLDEGENPLRLMYAFPNAIKWLQETLPLLESDGYVEGALTPLEQAAALFHDFSAGKEISEFPPHSMRPESEGIWELRTSDLRFFGWFWRRSVFILVSVETKKKCLEGFYEGHRNQAKFNRDRLGLDEPKYINGEISDVL